MDSPPKWSPVASHTRSRARTFDSREILVYDVGPTLEEIVSTTVEDLVSITSANAASILNTSDSIAVDISNDIVTSYDDAVEKLRAACEPADLVVTNIESPDVPSTTALSSTINCDEIPTLTSSTTVTHTELANQENDATDPNDALVLCPSNDEIAELETNENDIDPLEVLRACFPECSGAPPSPGFAPSSERTSPVTSLFPNTTCHDCGIEFQEVSTYNRHRFRAHGELFEEEPFEACFMCNSCGRTWPSLQRRKEHNCPNDIRSAFCCNMCHHDCRTSKGLREHKMRVHHIFPKRRPRVVPESQASQNDIPTRTFAEALRGETIQPTVPTIVNHPTSDSHDANDSPQPVVVDQTICTPDPLSIPTSQENDSYSCPVVSTRRDNTLHLLFPLVDPLKCTEQGCDTSYSSQSWNSNKCSLKRHLKVHHKIIITRSQFWCSFCKQQINKPSSHACLKDAVIIHTPDSLPHCCPHCTFASSSEIGLRNHVQSHKKKEAEQSSTQLSLPKIKRRKKKRNNTPLEPLPENEENARISNPDLSLAPEVDSGFLSANSSNVSQNITVAEKYLRLLRVIENGEINDEAFLHFCDIVEQFCTEGKSSISTNTAPPRLVTYNDNDNNRIPISDDAQALQKLYRRNKKRAIREVTKQNGERCSIDAETVENHFRSAWSHNDADLSYYPECEEERVEVLDRPFSIKEVVTKLKNADNTSPGPDKITYHHWRMIDPTAKTLCTIFNLCVLFRKIPPSWKNSTTILIPKDGDLTDLKNWRPIALSNTIYKLFTKCLTARLSNWCTRYNVLSHCQKGFLPHDGVIEHNFSLKQAMNDAKTKRKQICIAWLDVSNAFGTIPHAAILQSLHQARTGSALVELVQDLYSNCVTQIPTSTSRTGDIEIKGGVKQGCPLSGILFNFAIDPTLRRLQNNATCHKVLAFADDVALIAKSPAELQNQLQLIEEDFGRISLTLNPAKSFALHLDNNPIQAIDTSFFIGGQRLQTLQEFQSHKFLGKPVGYNPIKDFNNINAIGQLGKSILESLLAPWQRLEALKCFFFPSMQFAMRTGQHRKTDWQSLDEEIRKGIKQTLNIPENASNKYIYGARKLGCVGIPIAAEESDLNLIDTAFKLLTSQDETIAETATQQLISTCKSRFRHNVNDDEISKFMSGEQIGEFLPSQNLISNIWTLARAASRRIGVEWSFDQQHPTLHFQDLEIRSSSRRKILKTIRDRLRGDRTQALIAENAHQGKVLDCVSLSPASSHFFNNGDFTRFAEWRFVHTARLGLVPLNGYQSWRTGNDQRCRRCPRADRETLPHVLCHCHFTSRAWTHRHNAIVERVKKAISPHAQILSENKMVPGTNLRPDLIVSSNNSIFIVDITIPFENRRTAFDEASDRKIQKYDPLVSHFKTPTNNVQVVPIIVGALGSWCPQNDSFLRKFVSRSYLNLFRKLCVSDTIRWSRDIYIEHLSGIRQYDPSTLTYDVPQPNNEPEDTHADETAAYIPATTADQV